MAKRTTSGTASRSALELIQDPELVEERPVYAVFGPEEFLRISTLEAIRHRVLKNPDDDFAISRLEGKTAGLADLLDDLATPPFLSPRKLVILNDADDFVSAHREPLERYVDKPSRSGVLVLMVQSWPSNTRLAKKVASCGLAIDCRSPDGRHLVPWCRRWAKLRYGKQLQGEAAELLVELVSAGVGQLDCEIDKLSAYVGKRAQITAEDVDQLVASGRVELVWGIIDAAAAGDSRTALHALNSLMAAGEYPIMLLGALSAQLRRLAKAYRLVMSGANVRSALLESGIREFVLAKAQAQMRHLGAARLEALYDWLLDLDLGMKGESALSPQHQLEQLIIRVAARA